MRTAPRYNLQVMITISGTPKWANGGKTPNDAADEPEHLTQFAQMLAARYNGLHAGFGAVSRFAVWNEPNLELFLTPQFEGTKIVSPAIYAKLYMAAYKGIKAGQPARRGRGRLDVEPRPQQADRQERLGRAGDVRAPALGGEPEASVHGLGDPSVPDRDAPRADAEGRLPERDDDAGSSSSASRSRQWFGRRVPIWMTEYAEQTQARVPGRRLARAAGGRRQDRPRDGGREPVRRDVRLVHHHATRPT